MILDGCVLQCAKSCLNNVGVEPDVHYVLTDYGMKIEYHKDYNDEIVDEFYAMISSEKKKF